MSRNKFIELASGQKNKDYKPVWFMRQAGRYLSEYRAVRKKLSFLELCNNPELACEVSLQPIDIFGLDLVVIFSDILLPLRDLGFQVDFPDSGGIKINTPENFNLETLDCKSLKDLNQKINKNISSSCQVVELVRRKLALQKKELPIIGFCGGPWTLATYVIEGGSLSRHSKQKEFSKFKKLCYEKPREAKNLLSYFANFMAFYLDQQIRSGADLVQVFDTWAGEVSPEIFKSFIAPSLADLVSKLPKHVPKTLYIKNSSAYLNYLPGLGFDILSLDWKTDLLQAEELIFSQKKNTIKAFQGNLDPLVLTLESSTPVETETLKLVKQADLLKVPLVYNLGHGITPEAKVKNIKSLLQVIKTSSK